MFIITPYLINKVN